ncbi:hypothetical protein IAQ61_005355 [Plenodomus lingam]|uniref:uncharacterized protein n=1 Tax=Leptosphaeria maculans TaxID=5022 RepID=UPI0033174387|nr:hypothetical protein IAQ61_005355 [Plenodomus lingam]
MSKFQSTIPVGTLRIERFTSANRSLCLNHHKPPLKLNTGCAFDIDYTNSRGSQFPVAAIESLPGGATDEP